MLKIKDEDQSYNQYLWTQEHELRETFKMMSNYKVVEHWMTILYFSTKL